MWIKRLLFCSIFLGLVIGAILPSNFVLAASEDDAPDYVPGPETKYILEQPFGGKSSVSTLSEYIQLVYQFGLGIIGIIATVLIMFGGVRWISAAGNESIIGEAKEIIIAAVTGLTIALLSYIILLIINPQLVNISVNILKIPKALTCPLPATLVDITDGTGLDMVGSGQDCPNFVSELTKIAKNMSVVGNPAYCPDCVIHVTSPYRTAEQQAPLYACYKQCVDGGYMSADGLHKGPPEYKSGTPSGCNCVKTAPTCDSNHVKGAAADMYITDPHSAYNNLAADIPKQTMNNGGNGGKIDYSAPPTSPSTNYNADRYALQKKFDTIMGSTGKLRGISIEWWHFELVNPEDCGTSLSTGLTCTADASNVSTDGYCMATSSSAVNYFTHGSCSAATPSCSAKAGLNWFYLPACTGSTKVQFSSSDVDTSLGQADIYSKVPTCL